MTRTYETVGYEVVKGEGPEAEPCTSKVKGSGSVCRPSDERGKDSSDSFDAPSCKF